jgi:UDP-N-acetylglucosamine--N-acetylmuramyl-(pentapeptide) pyrophosphoryl-undecaprenol N-acetylglucosamine transferase
MISALEHLTPFKDRLMVIHQTGNNDYEAVAAAYNAHGFSADVRPFIMDMQEVYRKADLLVCRAGATSVAEITALGKVSILIPFARAVHDHQTKNAEVLVKAGAAEMIAETDLSGERLAKRIQSLCRHPEAMARMEDSSIKLGNWNAADDVVDACIGLLH